MKFLLATLSFLCVITINAMEMPVAEIPITDEDRVAYYLGSMDGFDDTEIEVINLLNDFRLKKLRENDFRLKKSREEVYKLLDKKHKNAITIVKCSDCNMGLPSIMLETHKELACGGKSRGSKESEAKKDEKKERKIKNFSKVEEGQLLDESGDLNEERAAKKIKTEQLNDGAIIKITQKTKLKKRIKKEK